MLTKAVLNQIGVLLSEKSGKQLDIFEIKPIAGGSINQSACLTTSEGDFFLKWNSASRFPGMFEMEVEGIIKLQSTNVVSLPAVIATGIYDNFSYLILQMLIPKKRIINYWEQCGREMAGLHKIQSDKFGLNSNNYIGSLSQSNKQHESGVEFMILERYEPLIRLAFNNRLLDASLLNLCALFYKKLPDLLPPEPASLLHGDLWTGNVITGPDGKAWLIDPSVYYGYRETDLAMARLFGGFDEIFFQAYGEVLPLQPGWEQRVELFQLYPLLVHLNLFGTAYRDSVIKIIKDYS